MKSFSIQPSHLIPIISSQSHVNSGGIGGGKGGGSMGGKGGGGSAGGGLNCRIKVHSSFSKVIHGLRVVVLYVKLKHFSKSIKVSGEMLSHPTNLA